MLDRRKNTLGLPSKKYTKKDFYPGPGIDHQKYLKIIDEIRNKNREGADIRIVGLGNPEEDKVKESIEKEDQIVSEEIAKMSQDNPETKVIIMYGDTHLAENKIPHLVEEKLKESGQEKKKIIIYQDVSRLYFKFMEQYGRHPVSGTDVVKLSDESYSIFTEHPLKKKLRCLGSLRTGQEPREIALNGVNPEDLIKDSLGDYTDWDKDYFESLT